MSNSKMNRTTFPMILHRKKVAAIYSTRIRLASHVLTANTGTHSASAKAFDHRIEFHHLIAAAVQGEHA